MSEKQTILYIEDDPASRRLLERMLSHAGYHVVLAERGLQGIDMARRDRPDLILTDINLPDISGTELTTALRNDDKFIDTPIVALTAQGNLDHSMAMAAGITGFLTKPVDIEKLLEQIKFYLEGGRDEITKQELYDAQVQYTRDVVSRLETRIRSLERANASLLKLDKMKETFLQITAHELRTPLTLVYGYARLLEDHEPLQQVEGYADQVQPLLEGLSGSIARMQDMIEEILIMSRVMTNQIDLTLSPTNLAGVVQSAIKGYEGAITDRELTVHINPDEWPRRMQADGTLLRLVIGNLLSNAIKYTPNGGHIYLKAETTKSHVQFSVRDTGIGINPPEHNKIFDQFYTLADAKLHSTSKTAFMGGGLGLGLAICRGVIEAHDGEIWVESTAMDTNTNPGSQFIVLMPLIKSRSSQPKSNNSKRL